jgi:hypothetical protein
MSREIALRLIRARTYVEEERQDYTEEAQSLIVDRQKQLDATADEMLGFVPTYGPGPARYAFEINDDAIRASGRAAGEAVPLFTAITARHRASLR